MPKRNRNLSPTPLPSSPTPIDDRLKVLEAAGLDDARQAALLRRAIDEAENALRAVTRVVSPLGTVVELGPDWHARLNAVKVLIALVGAAPSKSRPSVAVQTVINVDVPDWARPLVAPPLARAKIIEAKATTVE